MENLLRGIVKTANYINERIGRSVSWLTTLLVILICVDITRRFFFKVTATWIIELEWHLFALIFLLSAGFTLKHDRHVRVDLFYSNFSAKVLKPTASLCLLNNSINPAAQSKEKLLLLLIY